MVIFVRRLTVTNVYVQCNVFVQTTFPTLHTVCHPTEIIIVRTMVHIVRFVVLQSRSSFTLVRPSNACVELNRELCSRNNMCAISHMCLCQQYESAYCSDKLLPLSWHGRRWRMCWHGNGNPRSGWHLGVVVRRRCCLRLGKTTRAIKAQPLGHYKLFVLFFAVESLGFVYN